MLHKYKLQLQLRSKLGKKTGLINIYEKKKTFIKKLLLFFDN